MINISWKFGGNCCMVLVCGTPTRFKTQKSEKAWPRQQLLLDTAQNLISSRSFGDISWKFGKNHCMGLVCGTPTRFMPTAADTAAAWTAQATTITPALGAGVKKHQSILQFIYMGWISFHRRQSLTSWDKVQQIYKHLIFIAVKSFFIWTFIDFVPASLAL